MAGALVGFRPVGTIPQRTAVQCLLYWRIGVVAFTDWPMRWAATPASVPGAAQPPMRRRTTAATKSAVTTRVYALGPGTSWWDAVNHRPALIR